MPKRQTRRQQADALKGRCFQPRHMRQKDLRLWPQVKLKLKKVTAMKRIACSGIGLALALGLFGLSSTAQSQDTSSDSLGSYARQVRKDSGTKNKAKVFDNDNLPVNDKLSIVGQEPPPAADASTEAKPADSSAETKSSANGAAPAGDAKASDTGAAKTEAKPDQKAPSKTKTPEEEQKEKEAVWKQWGDKIAAQKDQIDLLARELDVLQREYQIRAAAMYADAGNRMRNAADWDKQDAQYKQQIADKQKALDDAKQKMDDLQEEARKAGVPASAREP
jgi:hypothetical protein